MCHEQKQNQHSTLVLEEVLRCKIQRDLIEPPKRMM